MMIIAASLVIGEIALQTQTRRSLTLYERFQAYNQSQGRELPPDMIPENLPRRIESKLGDMLVDGFEPAGAWVARRNKALQYDILERNYLRGETRLRVIDQGHRAAFIFDDPRLREMMLEDMLAGRVGLVEEVFRLPTVADEHQFFKGEIVGAGVDSRCVGSYMFNMTPSSIGEYEAYKPIGESRWFNSCSYVFQRGQLVVEFHYDMDKNVTFGGQKPTTDPHAWMRFK